MADELATLQGRYQLVCAQLGHKGLQRAALEAEIRDLETLARVLSAQAKEAETAAATAKAGAAPTQNTPAAGG